VDIIFSTNEKLVYLSHYDVGLSVFAAREEDNLRPLNYSVLQMVI
jgi:hypothetical protein